MYGNVKEQKYLKMYFYSILKMNYFHNYICIFKPEWQYESRWVRLSNLHLPISHNKYTDIIGDLWLTLWFYTSKALKTYTCFIYPNVPLYFSITVFFILLWYFSCLSVHSCLTCGIYKDGLCLFIVTMSVTLEPTYLVGTQKLWIFCTYCICMKSVQYMYRMNKHKHTHMYMVSK